VLDAERTSGDTIDVGDAVKRGLAWGLINQIGTRAGTFLTGVALFRILLPEQYGAYVLALAVIQVLFTVTDLGLDIVLIGWRRQPERALRVGVGLAWAASLAAFILCVLGAPRLADFANHAEATPVIRLMAALLLIDGAIVGPRAVLLRSFGQRQVALGEIASVPVNALVSIGFAVLGAGAWGPAIGTVVAGVVNSVLVIVQAPWFPWPGFDRPLARQLLGQGLPTAGAATVELLLLNVDTFIVAHLLGVTQLAFYALAFNVSSWPVTMISRAVRGVSITGLAHLAERPEALRRSIVRGLEALLVLVVPMCVALILLADPLVRTVYGDRSAPAAAALRWLAVLGGVRVLTSFLFDVLVSTGRARRSLVALGAWLAVVVPAMWAAAHLDGIRGVAIAQAFVAVGLALPLYLGQLRAARGVVGEVARQLPIVLVGATAMTAAGLAVSKLVGNPAAAFVAGGAAVAVTYGAVLVAPGRSRRQLRSLFRRQTIPAAD
jgi:PST family polysaccharide transporter